MLESLNETFVTVECPECRATMQLKIGLTPPQGTGSIECPVCHEHIDALVPGQILEGPFPSAGLRQSPQMGTDRCSSVPLLSKTAKVGLLLWDSRPEGEALAETPILHRKESRISMKMFVNLYNSDSQTSEIASTIDISCHGARVLTKKIWQPDQQLSVRSIRGDLYSQARVVHCQPHMDNSFMIGIEMYYPSGDWTTPARPGL